MRKIVAIIIFALLGFTMAQDYDSELVSWWLGPKIGGAQSGCPTWAGSDASCFMVPGRIEDTQVNITLLMERYSDVSVFLPWTRLGIDLIDGAYWIGETGTNNLHLLHLLLKRDGPYTLVVVNIDRLGD